MPVRFDRLFSYTKVFCCPSTCEIYQLANIFYEAGGLVVCVL